jgi:hypothetical protein
MMDPFSFHVSYISRHSQRSAFFLSGGNLNATLRVRIYDFCQSWSSKSRKLQIKDSDVSCNLISLRVKMIKCFDILAEDWGDLASNNSHKTQIENVTFLSKYVYGFV